eukprot:87137_1
MSPLLLSWLLLYLWLPSSLSYFTGPNAVSWYDGKAYCESQQTTLASIHSSSDFTSARALCLIAIDYDVSGDVYGCWIGLSDETTEGIFVNVDGSPSDFGFNGDGTFIKGIKPWSPNEPGSSVQDCVQLYKKQNYYYDDEFCSDLKFPVCNDAPTSSPTIHPTGMELCAL